MHEVAPTPCDGYVCCCLLLVQVMLEQRVTARDEQFNYTTSTYIKVTWSITAYLLQLGSVPHWQLLSNVNASGCQPCPGPGPAMMIMAAI